MTKKIKPLEQRIKAASERYQLFVMAAEMGVNPATLNRAMNHGTAPKQRRVIQSIEAWLDRKGF